MLLALGMCTAPKAPVIAVTLVVFLLVDPVLGWLVSLRASWENRRRVLPTLAERSRASSPHLLPHAKTSSSRRSILAKQGASGISRE